MSLQEEFFSKQNEKMIYATIKKIKPDYFKDIINKIPEIMKNSYFNTDIIFDKNTTDFQKILKLNENVLTELLKIIKVIEDHQIRIINCQKIQNDLIKIYTSSNTKDTFYNLLTEHYTFKELKYFISEIEENIIPKDDLYKTIKDYIISLEPPELILQRTDNKPLTIYINIDSRYRDITLWQTAGCFRFNIGLNTYKSQIGGLPQLRHIESITLNTVSFDNSWTVPYYNIIINEFTGNNYHSEPNGSPIFGTIIRKLLNNNFYDIDSCYKLFPNLIDLSTFTIKLLNYNFQDTIRISLITDDIIELACDTSDIDVGNIVLIITNDNISKQYTVEEVIDSKTIRINEVVEFQIDSYLMIDKFQWVSVWKFVYYQ